MSSWVDPETTIVVAPTVLTRSVDLHLVLYDPATDNVSHLDPVGAVVWSLMEEPIGLGQLSAQLADRFHVEPNQIVRDISPLISELCAKGLAQLTRST